MNSVSFAMWFFALLESLEKPTKVNFALHHSIGTCNMYVYRFDPSKSYI